jgi:DNA-binding NarL/FixJ family response regulator
MSQSGVARTVLLVDDHGGFRRMARLLLQSGGYIVIGEADTAAGAVESARKLEPDLVLLDVLLPDGNGVDVADELAALPHPPGIVLISSCSEGGLGARLADAPVLGFVRKDDLTIARLAELFG